MKRKPPIFGQCADALQVAAGTLRSSTSPGQFHASCPGALRRPGGQEPLTCACECHTGQDLAPPEKPDLSRNVEPGKRNRRLLDDWGRTLRASGSVSVEAPDDEKALVSLRNRMYTAARKQGLVVRVRVTDGVLHATVK